MQNLSVVTPSGANAGKLPAVFEKMRPAPLAERQNGMTTLRTESPTVNQIRWPERYIPGQAAVFAHNEIVIKAPIDIVWRLLIRAENWPNWYPNSADIHFLSHAGPDLRDRSRIRWNTFGTRITSKVLEFEPETRLAWNAHGIGVDAYHAWLLTPLPDGRTHVLTEETQNGWLARLGKVLMPKRMERKHQAWLEALSRQAQAEAA
jgi:uncharacterized protein YndB with AHSA1/START domain